MGPKTQEMGPDHGTLGYGTRDPRTWTWDPIPPEMGPQDHGPETWHPGTLGHETQDLGPSTRDIGPRDLEPKTPEYGTQDMGPMTWDPGLGPGPQIVGPRTWDTRI